MGSKPKFCLVIVLVISAATAGWAQLVPTVVRGPYLQSPTPSSMVVRWRTDLPSASRVSYGTTPGGPTQDVVDTALVTDHELVLTGLSAGTRYYYAVGDATTDLSSGPDHTFLTPPVAGTRQPIRIWTFGDSGQGTPDQAAVRDAYLDFTGERGTDVWLLLGDNAYQAGSDAEYQLNFFDFYPGVLRQVPAWSTFGNHENFFAHSATETGPYYDMFTFPEGGEAGGIASGTEAYFSFDYGNVHFINLNSQDVDRSATGVMLGWLEDDLAANTQEWTIVMFHHPVYSGGTHPSDTDTGTTSPTPPTPLDDNAIQEMRANALPILEAGGVDLVLTAHSHNYERSMFLNGHYGTSDTLVAAMKLDDGDGRLDGDGPYRKTGDIFNDADSGTVYAVVGTGAESLQASPHAAIKKDVNAPGTLVIDVDGSRLDARFIDINGDERDQFTIVRGDVNLPPIAVDDFAATAPLVAVTVDVLANDFDPEDDLLLITEVGEPARGTATDNGDGTITYVPAPDFAEGTDGFTYTIEDGQGNADTATVTITVACPPVADGAFFDDLEPAPEAGWTFDTPHNTNPASATWASVEDAAAHSPTHSWFSVSDGTTTDKDDRLVSPPQDLSSASRLVFWHRFDFELDYDGGVLEISTDGGASWEDLGDSILVGPYNGGPIFIGGEIPFFIDGDPRPAWTGFSGDEMTRVEVDLGAFAGDDRLVRWRLVADSIAGETGWWVDDVEFTALVTGPGECNLAPVALDDDAVTDVDTPVTIAVLANDSDPNGDPLTVTSVDDPASGTAAAQPDQTIVYTPDPGFTGEDAFLYEISDGELFAEALVTVVVLDPAVGPTRVRVNGDLDDGDGAARAGMHARVKNGGESGWFRYRALYDGGIDLDGYVEGIEFLGAGQAEVSGVCWLADGSPCSFHATAGDAAHPGAEVDSFGLIVFDAAESVIYSTQGALTKGHVKVD